MDITKLSNEQISFLKSCVEDRVDRYEREIRYNAHSEEYLNRVKTDYLPYARQMLDKLVLILIGE